MLSIICVYNDEEMLEKYLLKGLNEQSTVFETILIDNTDNEFLSAAEALNYGAKKAKGDILIFTHQDILFNEGNLSEIENYVISSKNMGIAGVAGVSEEINGVISNIKHGQPSQDVGKNFIKEVVEGQTLDECVAIIRKEIFDRTNFDQKTCDDWHLYVVDYCLTMKSKGYSVLIFPLKLYHFSPGYSISPSYYSTMQKLLKKHQENYSWIYTCFGNYHTLLPIKIQLILKKPVIYLLKKIGYWKYG